MLVEFVALTVEPCFMRCRSDVLAVHLSVACWLHAGPCAVGVLACLFGSHVYTNPAVVSQQQGLLVAPHHSHSCSGCPANMCKREVLQQHLEQFHPDWQQQKQQKQQLRLAYIGDGSNDLCPGQLLGPHDVLFVRAGYALDKLLQDAAVRATLSAQVHRWTSGMDILQHLQSLV